MSNLEKLYRDAENMLTENNSTLLYQSMVRYLSTEREVETNWCPLGTRMTDPDWDDIKKRLGNEPIEFIACDWGLYVVTIKKHFK